MSQIQRGITAVILFPTLNTALKGFLSSFKTAYPAPFACAWIAIKAISGLGYEM
jgi:hypothetical protein